MHFFDPERPTLSGKPLFVPFGQVRGVIPGLTIAPQGPDLVEVSGFFCKTVTVASRKHCTMAMAELPEFWLRWLADPELVAIEEFGYQLGEDPPKIPARSGQSGSGKLTLDDLGDIF